MARVETKTKLSVEDDRFKHSPINVMEELIQYFSETVETSTVPNMPRTYSNSSKFTSLIKFNGVPILPPLMTDEKREQMRLHRHQAVIAEARLRTRKREKLVSTVENIVSNIQDRKTPTASPRDVPETSAKNRNTSNINSNSLTDPIPNLTVTPSISQSTNYSSSQESLNDLPKSRATNSEKCENIIFSESSSTSQYECFTESSPIPKHEIVSGQATLDIAYTQSDVGGQRSESPIFVFTGQKTALVSQSKDSIPSTCSSVSTDSELNRTVIARDSGDQIADDKHCHGYNINADSLGSGEENGSDYSPDSFVKKDSSVHDVDGKLMNNGLHPDSNAAETIGQHVSVTKNEVEAHSERSPSGSQDNRITITNSVETGNHHDIFESERVAPKSYASSINDSDVHSLLGDYHQLPTPIVSGSPDMSRISYISDTKDTIIQPPNLGQYIRNLQRPLLPTDESLFMNSTETVPTLTTSSTLSKYMRGSGDTLVGSSLMHSEVADGDGNTEEVQLVQSSHHSNESGDHAISPYKLTRQGSYTLDKPSPALVEAHNNIKHSLSDEAVESSAQRCLDYGHLLSKGPQENSHSQENICNKKPSKSPSTDSENEGKEEHLHRYLQQISQVPIMTSSPHLEGMPAEDLQAQAEHFANIRQRLLQQQREQLATLLAEQEQEQAFLQEEMAEMQLRSKSRSSSRSGSQEKRHNSSGRRSNGSVEGQWVSPVGRDVVRNASANSSIRTISAISLPSGQYQQTSTPYMGMVGDMNEVSGVVLHARPAVNSRMKNIEDNITLQLHHKLCRVTATVKGFLTRRLMRTEKVQEQIKIINDTAEFAITFQSETPIKKGIYTMSDLTLQDRVIAQLRAALLEIHEIFFEISTSERMAIISQSREFLKEKQLKLMEQRLSANKVEHKVSAATKKALSRRQKAQAAEAAVFGTNRPKTAPPYTSSPKKKKVEDVSGPIRRQYQSIISKAVKPVHSLSPIKPHTDRSHSSKERSPRPKTAPESGVRQKKTISTKKNVRRSLYAAATSNSPRVTATTKPGWK